MWIFIFSKKGQNRYVGFKTWHLTSGLWVTLGWGRESNPIRDWNRKDYKANTFSKNVIKCYCYFWNWLLLFLKINVGLLISFFLYVQKQIHIVLVCFAKMLKDDGINNQTLCFSKNIGLTKCFLQNRRCFSWHLIYGCF